MQKQIFRRCDAHNRGSDVRKMKRAARLPARCIIDPASRWSDGGETLTP